LRPLPNFKPKEVILMRITQITPLVMMGNHSVCKMHKTNITPLRSPARETTNITPLRMCLNLNKSVWGIRQCVDQYKAHQITL
jgi:hypothetical protein